MELILTPSTMILMEGEPVVQQVESGQRHRGEKPEGLSGPGLGELLIYGGLL
uniref:Uncharacterized protein n=1 Tax=Physcomitrium patens TaxID=3218 RepID=A0A2K1J9Z9_PHYPA|nr:hypothetical protein PHYPA_021463 [Physcomitrium patens]